MWKHPFRVLWRLMDFGIRCGVGGPLSYFFGIWLRGRAGDPAALAQWLHEHAVKSADVLHMEITVEGTPPTNGMLVCNHLSYLDVVVLGKILPLNFVSKAEVRRWPVIGFLASCGGTLYLKRESKNDVVRVAEQFRSRIDHGVVVAIFPEGTSTDGSMLRPFRSSLLEPAAANHWPVTPAWLHYELDDGSVEDEVCYWRDMTFAPHFLNLLGKRSLRARVSFGTAPDTKLDRKQLARTLHERVVALAEAGGVRLKLPEEKSGPLSPG